MESEPGSHYKWVALTNMTIGGNALAESVIGLYKAELVRMKGPWKTIDELEIATLEWPLSIPGRFTNGIAVHQ